MTPRGTHTFTFSRAAKQILQRQIKYPRSIWDPMKTFGVFGFSGGLMFEIKTDDYIRGAVIFWTSDTSNGMSASLWNDQKFYIEDLNFIRFIERLSVLYDVLDDADSLEIQFYPLPRPYLQDQKTVIEIDFEAKWKPIMVVKFFGEGRTHRERIPKSLTGLNEQTLTVDSMHFKKAVIYVLDSCHCGKEHNCIKVYVDIPHFSLSYCASEYNFTKKMDQDNVIKITGFKLIANRLASFDVPSLLAFLECASEKEPLVMGFEPVVFVNIGAAILFEITETEASKKSKRTNFDRVGQ